MENATKLALDRPQVTCSTNYLGQLSLAIPLWVGAVSTGYSHCQGRKQ